MWHRHRLVQRNPDTSSQFIQKWMFESQLHIPIDLKKNLYSFTFDCSPKENELK